ncbi:error-prone DNA polymerase [Methylobacterium gnaphalii]|uniref:Error-prone DNA polymerase n=1 Tax=Methylobacterium gnaphalii TaxID=1010610 RepID=A0A512JIX7_9HYPH|nr:error-prone DNA polymerase [Methylobacterium gnaphalii]GEP09906.1 error-prone DNA polymerase [Methylobacterium gnaphalii]GJD68319.1 Error-prone DNA polymerase [Methylobacterium gnaphalii]GLS49935.1 error-prone DNA polymerase [Methylobacterium gnaphalii]
MSGQDNEPPAPPAYAELAAATNFSFLRGASTPQDMVLAALLLGQSGIGIADRNTVAGVVRAHRALKELQAEGLPLPDKLREGSGPGEFVFIEHPLAPAIPFTQEELRQRAAAFKLVVGARLAFADGAPDVIAYPVDRAGWGGLCRLLTLGNRRAVKGACILHLDDLLADPAGLLLIIMPPRRLDGLAETVARIAQAAPGAVWLGVVMHRRGDDLRRLARLQRIARQAQVPILALNDALYDTPAARDLQDVLTCIRESVTIEHAGRRLEANAERHLKSPTEMARLFRTAPEAVAETRTVLDWIDFSLVQLQYNYPDEPVPPGWTAQAWLEEQTWRRAAIRYPRGVPGKVETQLRKELAFIAKADYARYFLTILDIVRVAEDKGILCQGRGSAANSAVCYALGITAVDPDEHDLLFARFLSEERCEPPDIDVDFEHERREEIIQHIYERYGRHRAGIAATVIRYRPRSAMREVGKVLGLTEDVTTRLASTQWGSFGSDISDVHIRQTGLDPDNPSIARAIAFARRLLGFPRHLSQHVGGFVLSRDRLDEIVPIGNAAMPERTFIEWDKDDIDELKLMKVDVLALGMLTCIRKAFDLLREHKGKDLGLADIRHDDAVYAMLQRGDSLGVFQVESRAQMNMLPRLKPRKFYDLVIQVAIVRPGPIQGDMVHPYLRRRAGIEPVEFPSPGSKHGDHDELYHVLNRTKGVPLFQEQAMRLAMVAAKFSDVEANQLRRAMATFRHVGTIGSFEKLMVERMVARGYERDFAQRCFEQIKGFGSYGFPESHAASFAKLVYVSSWIKWHHPAVFACALLNAQPMGFYAPAQIVRDAHEHGVEIRAIDVNHSHHDNTLERDAKGELALRIGFRQVSGFAEADSTRLVTARGDGFADIENLALRSRLPARALRLLADADTFRSLGLDRRAALWAVRRMPGDKPLPLFAAADARELGSESEVALPKMSFGAQIAADYQTTRLSLKGHPMQILRPLFAAQGISTCAETAAKPDHAFCRTAGVVLVRQRPGAGNAIFITIEDETGVTNVVMWATIFERFRREVMGARLLLIEGRVQKSPEGVVHLMTERAFDRSAELGRLSRDRKVPIELTRADEFTHPQLPREPHGHPRNMRILPKSRDFH